MLSIAHTWFLGALLLIVGMLASLYLVWLQIQRGITTFSLLATSDALATVAIAIAFLINAAQSHNSDSRISMPEECSHGQLLLVSALFLAPFVNTFVSMIAHSAESLQSAKCGVEARGHDARNNPRLVSSIVAQWIVPAISTLVLFSAGIQHSRPHRDTCREGTSLTPIPVETMEQCAHQDISEYIATLMNAHNITNKHLLVNKTQSTDKDVADVIDNIYNILQIHRTRRSNEQNQTELTNTNKLEFNKWTSETPELDDKKYRINNRQPQFEILHYNHNANYENFHELQNKHGTSKFNDKMSNTHPKLELQSYRSQQQYPLVNRQAQIFKHAEDEYKNTAEFTNREDSTKLHKADNKNIAKHKSQPVSRIQKQKPGKRRIYSKIKSQRSPRSSPLENTPAEDAEYYDSTDDYYDKGEEESTPSELEDQNEPSSDSPTSNSPVTAPDLPSETSEPVNTIQPEQTSPAELEVSEAPLKPKPVPVTTQVLETTTHKGLETDLIEIQIPDTVNMCVVKCYLSDTFLKKYLFILLFLCYFIPIVASLTMYFSTPSTQAVVEVKPSTAEDSCNMQTSTLSSTTTVRHSILSSVLMWTPTLVETLLRAWFCVSAPQWLTMLLFMLAQAHALIRNSINLQLVRKRACTGSIQPLTESEDTPTELFSKVKAAILK